MRAIPVIAVEPGQILRFRRVDDFREALLYRVALGWRGDSGRCAGASGQQNERHHEGAEWIMRRHLTKRRAVLSSGPGRPRGIFASAALPFAKRPYPPREIGRAHV